MIDTKSMSEREIQETINACRDELDRRKRVHLTATANKALAALEELVKIAPGAMLTWATIQNGLKPLSFLTLSWNSGNIKIFLSVKN